MPLTDNARRLLLLLWMLGAYTAAEATSAWEGAHSLEDLQLLMNKQYVQTVPGGNAGGSYFPVYLTDAGFRMARYIHSDTSVAAE